MSKKEGLFNWYSHPSTELKISRLELKAQCKKNKAQCQMMQMMMATSMTHNNPISNIALNIQDSAATGIEKSGGLYEDVN